MPDLSKNRVAIRVWGEFACFSRPEARVERLSYDLLTPSAARGILEAIYWKPEIRWVIDRLHVLRPIQFTNLRRNEVKQKIPATTALRVMREGRGRLGLYVDEGDNRRQRAATVLRDVEYVIEAHFELLGGVDQPQKHYEIFRRRAERGQYFHHPYMGCREFPANFTWCDGLPPRSTLSGDVDLGMMLHDIDFSNEMTPRFFHAHMIDGVVEVPRFEPTEAIA